MPYYGSCKRDFMAGTGLCTMWLLIYRFPKSNQIIRNTQGPHIKFECDIAQQAFLGRYFFLPILAKHSLLFLKPYFKFHVGPTVMKIIIFLITTSQPRVNNQSVLHIQTMEGHKDSLQNCALHRKYHCDNFECTCKFRPIFETKTTYMYWTAYLETIYRTTHKRDRILGITYREPHTRDCIPETVY